MTHKTLGERLRELRRKRNLRQQDVAEMLGITQSAYGFYEQGRREPSYETLHKLSKIFGVSTDYLLGLTDDPAPTSENASPSPSPPPNRTRSDAPFRPKDPYRQMIDEAIEQLEPEERRIIEKIRSMPDLNLHFKNFESDSIQNLRDLVKIWRLLHPEDFENGGV